MNSESDPGKLGSLSVSSYSPYSMRAIHYVPLGPPDRLIKADGTITVEEWKSARQVRPWHRAQMGTYFILIEDRLGVRPTHGFIVCGDDARHRIDNTEELRAWVLDLAGQIRTARARVGEVIPVEPTPGQGRRCGMRGHCGQARM